MAHRVLLIGLKSSAVDFKKWPQLSVESLEAAFDAVINELTSAGYDARWCLTDSDVARAGQQVREHLRQQNPDVVVVGAGVRTDPDHLLLFEQVVNLVGQETPGAKIAFNTLPHDTAKAVKRWI